MIIRMKDIAEIAGVSIATVSKVLNGKDQNISEETKIKILKIVEETGYIQNQVAKSLKNKETKTLGIIMPDVMNMFFGEIAKGVEDEAEKNGYSIILCNSDNSPEKENKYYRMLHEKMVDGIIFTSSEKSLDLNLTKSNIPLVVLDRDLNTDLSVNIAKITVDNIKAGYEATNFLVSKGCRDIGFISSKFDNRTTLGRYEGYKNALKENGLEFNKKNIYLNNYSVDTGYIGSENILENSKIDGFFCGNDLIAMGCIKKIKELGYKIPEDIKVIGFDDIYIAKYFDPTLTTVRQPIYDLGVKAVQTLISLIENEDVELDQILETSIIERRST